MTNSIIKYLYANFLCKDIEQYINVIVPIYADFDKDEAEEFWKEHKLIADKKPRAEWNNNIKSKYF